MIGTPWERTWRALPTTLLVHLHTAVLCALPAAVLGLPLDRSGIATFDLRDASELFAQPGGLGTSVMVAASCAVVALLLSAPLMQLVWVRALATGEPTGACLHFGVTHYARAVFQSLAIGVLCVAGLCVVAWAIWFAHASSLEADEITRLKGLVLSALPATLWVTLCFAWHDLARAQLVYTPVVRWPELATALGQAVRPWPLLCFITLTLLAYGCSVAAVALCDLRPGLTGLLGAQLLLLGRSVLRSRWLAQATVLAERSSAR